MRLNLISTYIHTANLVNLHQSATSDAPYNPVSRRKPTPLCSTIYLSYYNHPRITHWPAEVKVRKAWTRYLLLPPERRRHKDQRASVIERRRCLTGIKNHPAHECHADRHHLRTERKMNLMKRVIRWEERERERERAALRWLSNDLDRHPTVVSRKVAVLVVFGVCVRIGRGVLDYGDARADRFSRNDGERDTGSSEEYCVYGFMVMMALKWR